MLRKNSVLAVLVSMLIFTGCSSGNQASKQTDKVEEAVNSSSTSISGQLSFYTSQPEEDATKLVQAFNKKYPDVSVETFRSGTEEVTAKLQAEKQAGQVQADVLLLADAVTFESLKSQNLLAAYKSPEREQIADELMDSDGMYTGTKVIATIIAANTDKVSTLPTSWQILTTEEAKDAAIMPSPLYSGAAAYNIGVFSRTDGFGWEFIEKLKVNNMSVIKGNGAVLKSVASGEKNYGIVVDYMVAREKAKGSPIDLSYPEEGVPIITEPIGIIENTDNIDAAKAFVDFVLSEDGQKLAAEIGYTPVREGVAPPEGLKGISDLTLLSGDIAILTNEREADKKQFTELFGN
ncbi:ABC transporter substrate-binding protein [Paenibacillus crassostreae]|uniref:ABC transporter substrate-binding protein n=1 Tax=Paenibacillus crassostreae TaxID=1763538 RepID=A0A167ANG3_9BACL|nr:ABC transporter substrate-binding protein [Paenibacillus crassostreae]AOZ93709.1 ABC transporter substrate-binding protein [Paenibacillus crassostreae]OAB71244.1 ABC transporter substrate-binding protein [Paenibacillus crassostreae]